MGQRREREINDGNSNADNSAVPTCVHKQESATPKKSCGRVVSDPAKQMHNGQRAFFGATNLRPQRGTKSPITRGGPKMGRRA